MSASAVTSMRSHGDRAWPLVHRLGRFLRTPKGTLLALFVPLLAVAGQVVGWSTAAPQIATVVGGACLTELLLVQTRGGSRRWPTSACLSGLIVALVLEPGTDWVVCLAVGALATSSKYLIRSRRGHIFNPAALALLLSIPLFSTTQSWWGALPDLPWSCLLAVIAGGAFLVDRLDRFPLVLSFLGLYFGTLTMVALASPSLVTEMFRAPFVHAAIFMALFMLTDPPTAPGRVGDQIGIGIVVAAGSCAALLLGAGESYLLVGLLLGNVVLAGWRGVRARTLRESELTQLLPDAHPEES